MTMAAVESRVLDTDRARLRPREERTDISKILIVVKQTGT